MAKYPDYPVRNAPINYRQSQPVDFDPLEALKQSLIRGTSQGEPVMYGVPVGTGYSASLNPSENEVNANNEAQLRAALGLPSATNMHEAQRQMMRGLLGTGPQRLPTQMPPMNDIGVDPYQLRELGYNDGEINGIIKFMKSQGVAVRDGGPAVLIGRKGKILPANP